MDIRRTTNGKFLAIKWYGPFCCWRTFKNLRSAEVWIQKESV